MLPYGMIEARNKRNQKNLEWKPIEKTELPVLYDEKGNRMHLFYLEDRYFEHTPCTLSYGRKSEYFIWDRFNSGLNYHLYTGQCALHVKGKPEKKFCLLPEAEVIVPTDYTMFYEHKGLEKEFDLIFTFSEKILNDFSNAVFVPASTVWIGTQRGGGKLDEQAYLKKSKMVSIVASNKTMTLNQIRRVETAKRLQRSGVADTFGAFSGGHYFEHIADALTDYRFQVVVENETEAYTFTEKIFNCFATMTVPLYYGATRISEYFNPDGIIILTENDLEHIEDIVGKLSEERYLEMLPAIKDNFDRVQKFLSLEGYIYQNYGKQMGL